MKLCKDCKHIHGWGLDHYCGALIGKPSPVDGRAIEGSRLFPLMMMRMTLCGWDEPKWWEPKPEGKAKP